MELSSLAKQGADLFFLYSFVKRLSTPFDKTKAFELGIIDNEGKILKKRKDLTNQSEKDAYTLMDSLIFNLKKLIAKVPFGSSRIASFAAALFLLKEHNLNKSILTEDDEIEIDEMTFSNFFTKLTETDNEEFLNNFNECNLIFEEWDKQLLLEDGIANSVGSGAIAGLGIDAPGKPGSGEPPGKSKLKRKKVMQSNQFMIHPKSFLLTKLYSKQIKSVNELCKLTGLNKNILDYHLILPNKDIILINEKTLESLTLKVTNGGN